VTSKKNEKNKLTKTKSPQAKTSQNLPQPPTFTTSHHKQPPLQNEEENTTLSTILRRVLLKLKKIWK